MAIKFEKIKPGMCLYDRHKYKMGNTTLRSLGEWDVRIIEVDSAQRRALVSWNSNSPEWYHERDLTRLSDWSMYDKDVAVMATGLMGRVYRCRKLTKAERAARSKP